MPDRYIKKILEARVYDVAVETPLDEAKGLSERLNNRILLKREDEQPVFSFKIRGAYNKMIQLPEADRARGVIAASAGNHAQGLAMAAQKLGVPATIVMPKTTPEVKVNNVRRYGGNVILHGDAFDAANTHAKELVEQQGLTYVHPFDDPDVIAGQGTVAMELLHQESGPIDTIFVPVGGGGLLAGVSAYVKYLRPETKVIGVESNESASMFAAFNAGDRVTLDQVGIFADGVAVAQVGQHTFEVAQKYVDEIITVSIDEICAAVKDIYDDTRAICEPSGALATAGMKKYIEREQSKDSTMIAICSGANVNFDRLRHIAERSELGENREAIIAVKIPERPGSFKQFCSDLGKRNITEFNYRYANDEDAQIFVGVQLNPDANARTELLGDLKSSHYKVIDLSDNEMAKLHVRYMVGGRAPASVNNEILYRFEFPERPGALMNFLSKLGGRWNISMFHYRNHGAAYGRVLVGLQVPADEHDQVDQFLNDIGYNYWEETDNPAYKLFLGN